MSLGVKAVSQTYHMNNFPPSVAKGTLSSHRTDLTQYKVGDNMAYMPLIMMIIDKRCTHMHPHDFITFTNYLYLPNASVTVLSVAAQ